MDEKFKKIEKEYKELEKKLACKEVLEDQEEYAKLTKRFSFLESLVKLIDQYKRLSQQKKESDKIVELGKESQEFLQLARSESVQLQEQINDIIEEVEDIIYQESDPDKDRPVIVEIRPAAGGQESSLFAADLFRMYSKFALKKSWKLEPLSSNPTEMKGFKEVIFAVRGKGVYSHFKFERGVHRVQRVPVTESGGRIHTSTVTVAVLKEPKPLEVELDNNDLRVDTYRSSGAGGQHVNTTDSAVRITHHPSGIVVACQDERSQIQNREKALRILKARLLEYKKNQQTQGIESERKKQVGTGERSEKIRTYNFPQRRATDHRGPITVYKLEEILEGDLDLILKPLISKYRKTKI